MLAALVDAGAHIDEETADAAFWAAVAKIDSAPADAPLPAEVRSVLSTSAAGWRRRWRARRAA